MPENRERLRLVADNRPPPEIWLRRRAARRQAFEATIVVLGILILAGLSIAGGMALDWIAR